MYILGKRGVPSMLGEKGNSVFDSPEYAGNFKRAAAFGAVAAIGISNAACSRIADAGQYIKYSVGWTQPNPFNKNLILEGLTEDARKALVTGNYNGTDIGIVGNHDLDRDSRIEDWERFTLVFEGRDNAYAAALLKQLQGELTAGRAPMYIVRSPAAAQGSGAVSFSGSGYTGRVITREDGTEYWIIDPQSVELLNRDVHPVDRSRTDVERVHPPLKRP